MIKSQRPCIEVYVFLKNMSWIATTNFTNDISSTSYVLHVSVFVSKELSSFQIDVLFIKAILFAQILLNK